MDNRENFKSSNIELIKDINRQTLPKHKDKTVLISMISGLFAGSISKLITHPMDTIKARVQVETGGREKIVNCLKSVIAKEGIPGLYRGIGVSVFGSLPANVLYFGTYEFVKKKLLFLNYFKSSEFLKYFIGGLIAETVSCLIYVPVDIIKERRQVQSKLKTYEYKSDVDAFIQIIKKEKIRGIYRAYWATIFSFGPMSAFYFMFYEYFKGFFVRNDAVTYIKKIKKEDLGTERLKINFLESLFCGILASGLAGFITTPLDLVKFRMQVQRADSNYEYKNAEYKNMIQGLIKIGYNEGIKGLFRGSCARVLNNTPNGALAMTILEISKPEVAKLLE
jgi:hypothetical protein